MSKFQALPPRKSLGQNFLHDRRYVETLVAALSPTPDDLVIEIGPGPGTMTDHLIRSGARVVAIELDSRAVELLRERYKEADPARLRLIEADFLNFSIRDLLSDFGPVPRQNVKVFGNIPYYITSDILFKLFEHCNELGSAVITMQKEVAQRVRAVAGSKTYGIPSVVAGYVSRTELVCSIPAGAFYPIPKVDSAAVRFDFTSGDVDYAFYKVLIRIVRAAFGQRRKTLRNALSSFQTDLLPESSHDFLSMRAEDLSVDNYIWLAKYLIPHGSKTQSSDPDDLN